jgi:hypothetical protein
MVQARGPHYGGMMVSPKSIGGEQSGLCHQMLENVLSSSPGSLNAKFVIFLKRFLNFFLNF